uniref:Uncharacterized protein n=1 Tax=Anguilla anguilla TaxID=7936 RepID=A0A0E9QXS0_ANGAN
MFFVACAFTKESESYQVSLKILGMLGCEIGGENQGEIICNFKVLGFLFFFIDVTGNRI